MERKTLITLLILATMSSGCAMSKMEATDVALEQARAESRAACVRARADADQARMAAIGAMEPGAQGYALMADAMARQAEALAGKDPCASGMGAYEARVAETSIENAGDKVSLQGDGNSYTQERVSSNSETSTRALGEGSSATSAAPVVSGPDKSSHTTIEVPEIEEPEAEQ